MTLTLQCDRFWHCTAAADIAAGATLVAEVWRQFEIFKLLVAEVWRRQRQQWL
jgi:hypothetical protein